MTLEESISGCKKNNPKSQKTLYEHLCGQMYNICLRYCKNESDAADVLQEGFIKVFQNIGQFRNEGNIAAWTRMIMVRTALDLIKKRQLFVSIEETHATDQEYEMHVDFDTYNYDKLLQHIKSMPVGYQTVFNLFIFEELSHLEIAQELNCSEGTSRSQLYKARKMMQTLIKKDQHFKKLLIKEL
jgi:RNA polymerase sigma-70 factor (ECF subfamily)